MSSKPRIDTATARALAVKAVCDPRTIRRVLHGEPVRPGVAQRARAVLIEAGLLPREAA
jgi:hypothetical protein